MYSGMIAHTLVIMTVTHTVYKACTGLNAMSSGKCMVSAGAGNPDMYQRSKTWQTQTFHMLTLGTEPVT